MMDSDNSEQNQETDMGSKLSGLNLMVISLISFLFYTLTALTLYYFFFDDNLFSAFDHGYATSHQILYGLLAGTAAAGVIIFFSTRPPVEPVLEDFAIFKVLKNSNFTTFDRVQLSIFAGVGEELLFRGALQPLIGIWLTSVIFVAIHGYFKFKSAGHILFGVLLFSLSMMLGYLYEYVGLISAMVAHAIYDILMLWWVARIKTNR